MILCHLARNFPSKSLFTLLLAALTFITVACGSLIKSNADVASPTPGAAPKAIETRIPTPTTGPNPEWKRVGLSGVSLNSVVPDPKQPATLYAGGKGVYKSTDNGKSWAALTTDFQAPDIAVSAANTSIIYAGATDGCAKGTEALSYRSDDGGKSWTAIGRNLRSYAPHPGNPDIVYAASCSGVVKSADKGRTWQDLKSDAWTLGYEGTHVVVSPRAPDVVYAMFASEGGTVSIAKSKDGGANWNNITPKEEIWVPTDLKIDHKDPNTLYAVTWKGIFRTTDGGATWKTVMSGLDSLRKVDSGFVSYSLSALALDPARPEVLYLATGGLEPKGYGIFRSWDRGEGWHDTGSGLGSVPVREVTFAGGMVYAATSDGVWRLHW